jgi:hypothetical protein
VPETPARLARLLDPAELDRAGGGRAKHRVEVTAEWLEQGGELSIETPARLACARCDGGGCDGCGRSGALRAPASRSDRTVHVSVPPNTGPHVALRLVAPFGEGGEIAQLILELCAVPDNAAAATPRAPASAPLRWVRSSLGPYVGCVALATLGCGGAMLGAPLTLVDLGVIALLVVVNLLVWIAAWRSDRPVRVP